MVSHATRKINRSANGHIADGRKVIWRTENRAYGLWSSCFLGTQRAVPLEHMEQLLPSALPGAQSSSSGALWRVRAHTAALLGAHIQQNDQISFSEHAQLLHRSTWIELLLPWRTQSCWSTWSSCSLGANTAAPLEHNEQLLPRAQRVAMLERVEQRLAGSRYSCSTGAHGAAASREHREQLCWSVWSSGSLGADTVASLV